MKIDLLSDRTEFPHDAAALRAQVCVVGGGIAGLVLADRLTGAGITVLLLEAGGRSPRPGGLEEDTNVELSGEVHAGSREDRPQALGGSSLVWGGQLLPMPPGMRWPVTACELERFYGHIETLLGVDHLPYEAPAFLQARKQPIPVFLEQMPRLAPRVSKFAPFGIRNLANSLGERLRSSARARMILHARVAVFHVDEGGCVSSVEVRTPAGKTLQIRADRFVVAAGTVETCRLLLASGIGPAGSPGNRYGQVGRGFHDHLTVEVARFEGMSRDRAVALFRPWMVGGLRGTMHGFKLEARYELCRKLGLNDALAHVSFEEPEGSGLAAVRAMLRARQQGAPQASISWSGLPVALRETWRMSREVRAHGRRYISPEVRVGLRINVAQSVTGRSRVELSDRTDRFGQPLARIHWEYAPADLRTIRVFADYLRRRFGRLGFDGLRWREDALPLQARSSSLGERVRGGKGLDRPLLGIEDARHAMGGACMGTDPLTSVVDPDLKVHGVENLYVASAAVFPDGRPQLPTMTLMALTMRLAEHLRVELTRQR